MKQYSPIVIIIIGALAAAALIAYNTTEGFWNLPSRGVKVDKVYTNNGVDFWQTPNFQGTLSPRFSNVNYGPYIKANLPAYNNMAVPSSPLGNSLNSSIELDMKEKFDDNTPSSADIPIMGMVPATGGLLATYDDKNGERRQAISFNRYMYSNKSSRLRALGDPIRGDIPIVPASGNWFVPSVHPNLDLQAGALPVMGGVNNNTNRQLAKLIYATSGGTDTTIGGVNLKNPAQMNNISEISGGADIVVTSFP